MSVKVHASATNRMSALSASDRGRVFSWFADFAANPKGWGNRLHKWERSPGLWTGRVDDYIRAVLVQDGPDWFVLFVGKHKEADRWADGHKAHVEDGVIVLEFTSDGLRQIEESGQAAEGPAAKPIMTEDVVSDAVLSSWGLGAQAIAILRAISDPNVLLEYAMTFPEAVADKVLGAKVDPPTAVLSPAQLMEREDDGAAEVDSLDIRRVYRIVDDSPEFRAVIDQPMAAWIAFLHPTQRRLATSTFGGPVKVSGSAGTGKTVVALHRARHLAQQGKRVLLTTFEDTLCANLREQLAVLCSDEELEKIKVQTVHEVAMDILDSIDNHVEWDRQGQIEDWLEEIALEEDFARSPEWYVMEWEHVVHANDVRSLEEYLEISRRGRGSALKARDREVVWGVFEQLFAKVREAGITDGATICRMAREALERGTAAWPCDAVVVDEMQDLRPQELRFLAVLGNEMPDGLMLVGDMTQRIYVPRFTMKSADINVRGRSYRLKINYRTTRPIRDLADGVVAPPGGRCPDCALSVREGREPRLRQFATDEAETKYVSGAITRLIRSGSFEPHDIAVFAPDPRRLDPVVDALQAHQVATHRLSSEGLPDGHVRIGAMRRAKGLEFKAVFVIGVSADALPDPATVQHLFEAASREEAFERERQTLYVAMTRARDELEVSWVREPSPFLRDIAPGPGTNGAEA